MKLKRIVMSLSLVASLFAGNSYAYNEDLFEDSPAKEVVHKEVAQPVKKNTESVAPKPKAVVSSSSTIIVDKKPINDPKYNKIVLEPIPEKNPPKKIRLPSAFEDTTPVAKMVDYNEYLKTQKKVEKPKAVAKPDANQTPEQYVDDFFDYNNGNTAGNQIKVKDSKDTSVEQNISNFFEQYNSSNKKPVAKPASTKSPSSGTPLLNKPATDKLQTIQQPKVILKNELQKKDNISLIPIPETLPKRQYIPHAIRGDKVSTSLLGSDVYIRIFKQEHSLEMYLKQGDKYYLANVYDICTFYGGLGPKKVMGDNKSPEGFYKADISSLQPNSSYYKAINIGFPNKYDQSHGYTGKYLMIHGGCKSIGCYAMTNDYIKEIYQFVQASFKNGQRTINIDIYPFKMTDQNLIAQRGSPNYDFWKQLQPGYKYFEVYRKPPEVDVIKGKYVVDLPHDFQDPENAPMFAKN